MVLPTPLTPQTRITVGLDGASLSGESGSLSFHGDVAASLRISFSLAADDVPDLVGLHGPAAELLLELGDNPPGGRDPHVGVDQPRLNSSSFSSSRMTPVLKKSRTSVRRTSFVFDESGLELVEQAHGVGTRYRRSGQGEVDRK